MLALGWLRSRPVHLSMPCGALGECFPSRNFKCHCEDGLCFEYQTVKVHFSSFHCTLSSGRIVKIGRYEAFLLSNLMLFSSTPFPIPASPPYSHSVWYTSLLCTHVWNRESMYLFTCGGDTALYISLWVLLNTVLVSSVYPFNIMHL